MRLAWFTPWAPQRTGVAVESADIVARLAAAGHAIDVFVDERVVPVDRAHGDEGPAAGAVRVQSAHDFVWRTARGQYDLAVYQAGNSRAHAFIWPYLVRWPGLAVLHDARVHHARGHAYLSQRRADAYRARFAHDQPDVSPDAAELAVAGFDGTYYYLWPMTRSIVEASRAVAVHTRGGAAELAADHPGALVAYVPIGGGSSRPVTDRDRRAARERFGLADGATVFGVFGALTAEKRLPQILGAFRVVRACDRRARLLLAGRPDPDLDLPRLIADAEIGDAVLVRDALDAAAFDQAIAASDVVLNLRWPSATETSGPWVRSLAAARPTVIVDLPHQVHVPSLDPRAWAPWLIGDRRDPVTIAIDILDEDHSLRLAMRRLAEDRALRERVGAAARRYWEAEHAGDRVLAAYETILARAAAAPLPARPAITGHADTAPALLAPFGEVGCEFF